MTTKQNSLLLTIALLGLQACASVDFDYPKEESYAPTDTSQTTLGKNLGDVAAAHNEGEAGFYPMNDAIDALAIRLVMADAAEVSIDAQYYLLTADPVGYAFIDALLAAADRGVRVRLLLDDILTSGYDAGMAALDSHPNFEVRIFNPFANRKLRAVDGITSFSRVNRRMHNKSFTVDNQITLIGGRNIAAEYFGGREDSRFGDLDVLGIGPVVQDVSGMFDGYWNHEAAVPVPGFAKMPDDPDAALVALREKLAAEMVAVEQTPYGEAVVKKMDQFIDDEDDLFSWAPYTLAVDSPDKSDKKRAAEAASIVTPLRESILGAESEVLIISPYFVPRKTGEEVFLDMEQRGVDVRVITNSLAANNQKTVHGGYAPSRKPLLAGGVELYEVRADAAFKGSELTASESGRATLHTKAFIVDRKELFIGSFNFDPRSANINTELGVIIRSPELAASIAEGVDSALPSRTYEVFLDENNKVRWRGFNGETEVIYTKEPDTSGWDRFVAGFFKILPIRSQL